MVCLRPIGNPMLFIPCFVHLREKIVEFLLFLCPRRAPSSLSTIILPFLCSSPIRCKYFPTRFRFEDWREKKAPMRLSAFSLHVTWDSGHNPFQFLCTSRNLHIGMLIARRVLTVKVYLLSRCLTGTAIDGEPKLPCASKDRFCNQMALRYRFEQVHTYSVSTLLNTRMISALR